MRNILSYRPNCKEAIFTGEEIKEFIKDQIENNKSHAKEARRLLYFADTMKDDRLYKLVQGRLTRVRTYRKILFERVEP